MNIGIWQIALIVLAIVILFGLGKLPTVMGDVGRGIRNFKKGLSDNDTLDDKSDDKQDSKKES
jgi:sec-independent protein translocase protein TatA